jgi:D-alanyl-D-alanine carboxypeptidase-like protein/putative Flp pilus-assembly TadE/G-like protein
MSVVLLAILSAVAIGLTAFAGHIAEAVSLKARAQTAADAAALAAVAESGPYGRGIHEVVARRYAGANGARLVKCLCDRGATAVQVEVAVEGVEASARAVINPELFMPAQTTIGAGALHPALEAAVNELIAASGGRVYIKSGLRSTTRQAELWAEALERYGSPEAADDWVAPPGHSMHERGLAVDLGGDIALAVRLVEELGLPLWRPMSWEPWHFELKGSRG